MNIFTPTNHTKLVAHQLKEARMALLEHQKAAEFNAAMADMLILRIMRLERHQKGASNAAV